MSTQQARILCAPLGMYRVVVVFSLFWITVAGDCRFPSDWHGRWFQSGLGEVVIRNHSISRKGTCHEHHRDYYLVENRERSCFQCLLLMHRHQNIIQYKESYCLPGGRDSLPDICNQIRVEAILYTLVREPSLPVRCPFQDAYMFSYNNNTGGFCRMPYSYVHACASDAKFRFNYKHCPEAAYTYDQELDFECLASWKDGSDMFMYGSFASPGITRKSDVYRCFMFQMLGTVVYLAMSADATCRGLRSPRDGPLVMEFTQDVYGWPSPGCTFPSWFSGTTWQDLSGRHLFIPDPTAEKVTISHRRHAHSTPRVRQALRCITPQPLSMPDRDFVAVSYSSQDCTTHYQCVKIVRRHSNILEVYSGDSIEPETQTCDDNHFKDTKKHVVYPRSLHGMKCPYKGRYRVTSDVSSDCRIEVVMSCTAPSQLDVVSSCVSKPVARLECLQTWSEGNRKFLIARQLDSDSATANCFTFRELDGLIEFSTDRRCNRGAPFLLEDSLSYTLDSLPGSCELPVEKPRVTQPVERSEEPRHNSQPDRGYKVAPPEDDPNVSSEFENEYENKHAFFHNGAAAICGRRHVHCYYTAGVSLLLTVLARVSTYWR